jgi:putative transposase
MRPPQSTLRPATVHAYANRLLVAELELRDYKQSVPAPLLASVLLLAACWQASLSAACQQVRGTPSHESVRKALHAALPPRPRDLLARLLAALRRSLPGHLGNRPLPFALDLHQRPYYGRPTRGSRRGPKKKGTRKAFTYATLAALAPEGRFSAGLLPVRPHMRLTTIVERLLRQAAEAGLCVAYLLLDKEFYAAEVIDWLQRHGVAFLMPAVCRGKPGAGTRGLFEPATAVGWYEYTWTTQPRRYDFKSGKRYKKGRLSVTVRVCVARHPTKGKRLVYASWGLGRWPPAVVVQQYRRRFGIEVKYRQLGQCLAPTCSRDERVRLLLVGVALLLCNLWAWLHAEVFARGPLGERRRQLPLLRLRALVRGLAEAIVTALGGLVAPWPAQRPLPPELAHLENLA